MPRHRPPSPSQLRLTFEPVRNQPPESSVVVGLLEALAELLLAAMGTTTVTAGSREADDEHQDRR